MSAPDDWMAALRREVGATSIAAAARRIGVSRTTISLVLAGKYPASTESIADKVRQALAETIACPVLGEVTPDSCRDTQAMPWSPSNPSRIALYRGCRSGCAHSSLKRTA